MKKLQRLLSIILSCSLIMGSSVTAFASESPSPRAVGTTVTHSWSFDTVGTYEETSGGWVKFYTGHPAARDGEYDTVSHSISYSHTFSGTIGGDLKGKIQAQLGYSFGKTQEFGIAKNSAPLKKGEYVRAYYTKNFDVTKIRQTDLKRTTGYELAGGQYHPVDRIETIVSYVYAKKAIQPKIKLEYWKDGKKVRTASDRPFRTEYYELVNGKYQMKSVE